MRDYEAPKGGGITQLNSMSKKSEVNIQWNVGII